MKQSLPMVFAFILGLIAVVAVQGYLKKKDREVQEKIRPVPILVASQDIPSGTRLSQEMIAKKDYPSSLAPKKSYGPKDIYDIINRPVARDIYRGEVLNDANVGIGKQRKKFSQNIHHDERAMTISVSPVAGVDYYIRPNDRIDLFATMGLPVKKEQTIPGNSAHEVNTVEVEVKEDTTILLLQNVLVMATGQSYSTGIEGDYTSLTISVTPQEAAILQFAIQQGVLTAVLRNETDFSEEQDIEMVNAETFKSLAKVKELNQRRKKRIEVYRQGEESTIRR